MITGPTFINCHLKSNRIDPCRLAGIFFSTYQTLETKSQSLAVIIQGKVYSGNFEPRPNFKQLGDGKYTGK